MDKLIVFLIIAVAAAYVIRRFFFKRGNTCGCGCSGCGGSAGTKPEGGSCCGDDQKSL